MVIDARGMAVAPGFIDPHSHTDTELIANPRGESYIRQGITTAIGGNCGSSWFPVGDATFSEWKEMIREELDIEMDWKTVDGLFGRLESTGIAYNFATLVGHGAIRRMAMGLRNGAPTDKELELMKRLLERTLRSGVYGLSTGLEYLPGTYAQPEEITELCRLVAEWGGVYATHMRSEGDSLLEALDESITVARESGVSLEISHLKVAYPENWSKIDAAIGKVEDALDEGIEIEVDRYPYTAASTGLALYFPSWAISASVETCTARLKNPANSSRLNAHLDLMGKKLGSWNRVSIVSVHREENMKYQGKDIVTAAAMAKLDVNDFLRELMIAEKLRVSMNTHMMNEQNTRRILAHPLTSICTDAVSRAPYGVLGKSVPHPRTYGAFPRVLGKYVREEKLFPLHEAIRKMTSKTAHKFGINARGMLKAGCFADVVVFDPATVRDTATWSDPHRYPEGIPNVIVNGVPVIRDGEHSGRLPGMLLRKERQ